MINQPDLIKPKSVKPGDTVAFIAPAGPVTDEQLLNARQRIENLGFKVSYSDRILSRNGYLAGDDKSRLTEFHEAFEDHNNNLILCIRGGYGCSRIVDKIDFNLVKRNPKIFFGFSDITVLLNAIYQKTGLITFHGVVGNSGFSEYTKKIFLDLISCQSPDYKIEPFNQESIGCITEGKASGRLIGGNLSIINSLVGTDYDLDFKDKLVFIEDIDEAPYRIDRMLTQLLLAGKLQKAAGIILGDFRGCDIDLTKEENINPITLNQVLRDRLGNLGIPVMTGFSFGHVSNQAVFPVGIMAELDTNQTYIRLLENAVE
jgi:muramoyltetrapeptide carboxypeptidase